ncbi:hypothetical protein JB92DRAFT_2926799 [Gautieria morchelliformis]|nr:hypothetical protein JB92DRAFT_2926799 [Gautieria morchelliformis]
MQPPVPYPDFAANFPGGESLFDGPVFAIPDLPADSNLLSSAESNSFFGFLDKFEWEFDPVLPHGMPMFSPTSSGSDTAAPSAGYSPPPNAQRATRAKVAQEQPSHPPPRSSASSSSSPPPRPDPPHHNHTTRTKPLLSTPQKRLNHIMSEQKRRNAIRDGYATLTNMLAPAGAPIGSGIPTRGRPKGSGTRGKKGSGGAKGKSGVLFRAVEYCRWLEEGCEALRKEVERIEVTAGFGGQVL